MQINAMSSYRSHNDWSRIQEKKEICAHAGMQSNRVQSRLIVHYILLPERQLWPSHCHRIVHCFVNKRRKKKQNERRKERKDTTKTRISFFTMLFLHSLLLIRYDVHSVTPTHVCLCTSHHTHIVRTSCKHRYPCRSVLSERAKANAYILAQKLCINNELSFTDGRIRCDGIKFELIHQSFATSHTEWDSHCSDLASTFLQLSRKPDFSR